MRDYEFSDYRFYGELNDTSNWADSDLVGMCREGGVDAYAQLVRRYALDAYRLAYALVGNPEDAYDVTSEAFVSSYPKIRALRSEQPFSVMLFREVIESSRRVLQGRGVRTREYPDLRIGEDRGWDLNTPWSSREGFCSVEARRTRQTLEAALSCIPFQDRLVLILRDVVGFTMDQAARVLGWPVKRVQGKLANARAMVIRILQPKINVSLEAHRCRKVSDMLSDYLESKLPSPLS